MAHRREQWRRGLPLPVSMKTRAHPWAAHTPPGGRWRSLSSSAKHMPVEEAAHAAQGASSWVGMAVAALVLGAAEGPQLTALFSVRHRHAPGHLRAQVFTVGASLKISAFALGAAVAGPLVEHSVVLCLAVAAGVHLLAALTHGVLSLRRSGSGAVTGV